MTLMTCDLTREILLGGGTLVQRARARRHLRACVPCQQAVREGQAVARTLAATPAPMPPDSLVSAWQSALPATVAAHRPRHWALLAAPLLAVGLWFALQHLAALNTGRLRGGPR